MEVLASSTGPCGAAVVRVKLEPDSDGDASVEETAERKTLSALASSEALAGPRDAWVKQEHAGSGSGMAPASADAEPACGEAARRRLPRKTSGSSSWGVKREPQEGIQGAPAESGPQGRFRRTIDWAAKEELKDEVKSEEEEDSDASASDHKGWTRVKGEVKEELSGGVKSEDMQTVKSEITSGIKAEIKSEIKNEVKDEFKHEVKDELKQELKCEVKTEIDFFTGQVKKEEATRGVKRERQEEGSTSEGEGCRGDPAGGAAEARRRIRCKRGQAKQEVKSEPQDARQGSPQAKWPWQKNDASTSFAARLPWFISQCRAFQIVERTWAPARPCCLANSFIQPLGPPAQDEKSCYVSCYERLSKEQRQQFRAYVENVEAQGCMKRTDHNKYFLKLLHPEPQPVVTREASGVPRQRLLVTPPEMKMWPWMRDLDVRWWIGCGWILTDEGPVRLSETASAPGTEIFEGRGCRKDVPEERMEEEADAPQQPLSAVTEVPAPVPPSACGAVSGTVLHAMAQQPDTKRRTVRIQEKQSGVPNVSWNIGLNAWQVRWHESAARRTRLFIVHRYMELGGKSYEEADAAALRDAIAFRASLAREGKLKEAGSGPRSLCKGVAWHPKWKAWRVRITLCDGTQKEFGRFRPLDGSPEEVEKARLAAVQRVQELEREHLRMERAAPLDAALREKRESGVPGVHWDTLSGQWRSKIYIRRRCIMKNFRPKDASAEEIEAARLLAVQFRRELERQHRGAAEAASG